VRASRAGPLVLELLQLPRRSVHYLPGSLPAVFYFVDDRAGGILINAPRFSAETLSAVTRIAPLKFIFLPSRFGARDLGEWRSTSGAKVLAGAEEIPSIDGPVDEAIDGGVRFYGRLDFLALSGRTRGTVALRSREDPGIIFFGPALDHADWPQLRPHDDDYSWENRLIGALSLRDIEFEHGFCDNYVYPTSRHGPRAGEAVRQELAAVLA